MAVEVPTTAVEEPTVAVEMPTGPLAGAKRVSSEARTEVLTVPRSQPAAEASSATQILPIVTGGTAARPTPASGTDGPGTYGPGTDLPGTDHPGHRPRRRPGVGSVIGAVVLVVLLVLGFSIGHALGAPTSDSASAKLAEWARDHHLGAVVSFLEQKQLDLHPAKTGGTVAGGFHAGGEADTATTPSGGSHGSTTASVAHTQQPADLKPFGSSQPGEGQWQVLVRVKGQPALQYAGLTPDAVHTSYAAAVAWMDPKLLSFQLRPGASDPGGTFAGYPPSLAGSSQQRSLVAAFNAGFRLNSSADESQGGFYLNGRTAIALRSGAASFVVYKNGTATVGQWGRDVAMSSSVLAVRQNLKLLIDHGTVASTVDQNNSPVWGYTLGSGQATWRSGVGVTRSGAIVYADGPVMTTRTLAEVLQRAGAVQAMELDINPEWTHLDWFTHTASGLAAHKLNPAQQPSAEKYLSSDASSRDFFAVSARP